MRLLVGILVGGQVGDVNVGADQSFLFISRCTEDLVLECLTELGCIGERTLLPCAFDGPDVTVVHALEGFNEGLAIHRVDLIEVHGTTVNDCNIRAILLANVEEEQVQDEGYQRTDGHAGTEDDLQP